LFIHPVSLFYSLDNKEFLGFVTIEKEMNRIISLIFKPQILFQELSLYDNDWSGTNPYYPNYDREVSLHQTQLKINTGLRIYKRKQQGPFIQVNGGLGFGHCKSIDSEQNKNKFLYATGSMSSTVGR